MEAARLQELISREPKQTLFEGCGSLHILSKNGDDRIVWDRRFKDQIAIVLSDDDPRNPEQ